MSLTLKQVFDNVFANVKFDRALCNRIIRFSQSFMTRNADHSAFFGGVLLGVNPIRFFDSDRDAWYEEVLQIEESALLEEFRKAEAINFDFKVMADAFNYTPAYVVHRLEQEKTLPQQIRQNAQVHAFMVLHYRYLTSLLVRRFKYPADPKVAQATYNSLSGRFDIKRLGSWRALLEDRSEGLIATNSIYWKTIQTFKPDPSVIRIVTDTQGRIREVVNKIYAVHIEMDKAGVRFGTTTDTYINHEGEMVLKDRKNGYANYLRYIENTVPIAPNFIKSELVDVITNAMPTMPPKLFDASLRYLSNNYNQPRMRYLNELVKEDLLYTFNFLNSNRALLGPGSNLPMTIARLRALFTASRSSDPTVLKLRTLAERLVRASVTSRNAAVIAAVRTGVLLYISLRALTKNHYS